MLSAQMFSGRGEGRTWAIETTVAAQHSVGQIIDIATDMIVEQLLRDTLVAD